MPIGNAIGCAIGIPIGLAVKGKTFILDRISPASAAAYSLRKLRAAYSGSAIRVRRSSDNLEADIGFTAYGDLDQVALLAHCGAGNGFVTTWYDQGYFYFQTKRNLLTYSEGKVANLNVNSGVTDATTSITPYFNSIQFGNNSVQRYAYKTFTPTVSITYTLSVFVQMDDDSVPVVGSNSGIGDFCMVLEGAVNTSPIVTAVGGNVYRVSASKIGAGAAGNFGIFKNTPQSTKGFRITGYQLEVGTMTAYQPMLTGSALDATQATAANQPAIVSGGVVVTQNSKPAVSFDGTDDVFTGTIPSLTAHSINLVTTSTASGSDLGLLTYSANTINQGITHHLGANLYSYFSTGADNISRALALNTPAVITRTWDGTASINNANLYIQSVAATSKVGTPTSTDATTTLTIGRAASFATQKMQELTVFSSAISDTDRQTLERNQGQYYAITVA